VRPLPGFCQTDTCNIYLFILEEKRTKKNKKIKVAKLLLAHGAAINARTHENWTPLHLASAYGSGLFFPPFFSFFWTCVSKTGRPSISLLPMGLAFFVLLFFSFFFACVSVRARVCDF
jgi:hypothetical protein